jgi:hypothetical protein
VGELSMILGTTSQGEWGGRSNNLTKDLNKKVVDTIFGSFELKLKFYT